LNNIDSFKFNTENAVLDRVERKLKPSQFEVLSSSTEEMDHHFLLITLDNGMVNKAVIAKVSDASQTLGVASLSEEKINQFLLDEQVDLQSLPKDAHIKSQLETRIGFPIDHVIAVEKSGYIELFSRIFPDGIPLEMSNEMNKDIQLLNQSEIRHVDAKEFIETIKALKQTKKYDQEVNQLIIDTVSTQLSKPEITLALVELVTEVDQYLFTDLTLPQLISLGLNLMKNPGQAVQKLELPTNSVEEVIHQAKSEKKDA
jgi:uncharacterized membrane protein YheB (UPF0754 family)